VRENRVPMSAAQQTTQLTPAEMQAIFKLVLNRPVPVLTDDLSRPEAILLVAANLLRGYGFNSSSVLMAMNLLWAAISHGDTPVLMLNVIDRRYVGWNSKTPALIDMITGAGVPIAVAIPIVLESVAYNLNELLERRIAMARGERVSLWEGKDATGYAPPDEAPGSGGSLGRPPVFRDDPGHLVP